MRRKKTKEELRKAELFKKLIQLSGVKDRQGVQNLIKKMLSGTIEQMLEAENQDERGYSEYDYKNKEIINSKSRYINITLQTHNGEIELSIPSDRDGEVEPQIISKYGTRVTLYIEKTSIEIGKVIETQEQPLTSNKVAHTAQEVNF